MKFITTIPIFTTKINEACIVQKKVELLSFIIFLSRNHLSMLVIYRIKDEFSFVVLSYWLVSLWMGIQYFE